MCGLPVEWVLILLPTGDHFCVMGAFSTHTKAYRTFVQINRAPHLSLLSLMGRGAISIVYVWPECTQRTQCTLLKQIE